MARDKRPLPGSQSGEIKSAITNAGASRAEKAAKRRKKYAQNLTGQVMRHLKVGITDMPPLTNRLPRVLNGLYELGLLVRTLDDTTFQLAHDRLLEEGIHTDLYNTGGDISHHSHSRIAVTRVLDMAIAPSLSYQEALGERMAWSTRQQGLSSAEGES